MIMSHSDDVETEVLNALQWDLAVPPHRVRVEVENGWVTMSGILDRPYQRECAESDARRVPGVVGVNNQLRLAPAKAEHGSRCPLAIDGSPPARALLPRMTGNLSGVAKTVVVSLISTALRRQSARRRSALVNYGLTEDRELAGSGVTRGACS